MKEMTVLITGSGTATSVGDKRLCSQRELKVSDTQT
jgi:hypothetical protein